jgi:hypothetical protein
MRRCRNRNASSSGSAATLGRTSSFRTSPSSREGTSRSSGANAATAPPWNTWPSTAPRSSAARSPAGSWSSRAASSAWIDGGTATSPGDSSSIASICSTNSGLPSDEARMRPRRSASSPAPASRPSISSSVSIRLSGSSSTVVALSFPPPQPDRRSRRSGRARHRSMIGASRDQSATCSIRSRNVGSPHCTSSSTTTKGREVATDSKSFRVATAMSSADAIPSPRSAAMAGLGGGASASSCSTTSTIGQ